MLVRALMAAQRLIHSHMPMLAECIQARQSATLWHFDQGLDSYAPCAVQVHAADDRLPYQGTADQAAGVVHVWRCGSWQDHAHGFAGRLGSLLLPGLWRRPVST